MYEWYFHNKIYFILWWHLITCMHDFSTKNVFILSINKISIYGYKKMNTIPINKIWTWNSFVRMRDKWTTNIWKSKIQLISKFTQTPYWDLIFIGKNSWFSLIWGWGLPDISLFSQTRQWGHTPTKVNESDVEFKIHMVSYIHHK